MIFSLTLLSRSMIYRHQKFEYDKEHISFTFNPRDMLLSVRIGFSFVSTTGACAILENISVLSQLSFYLDFRLDAFGAVCHLFNMQLHWHPDGNQGPLNPKQPTNQL